MYEVTFTVETPRAPNVHPNILGLPILRNMEEFWLQVALGVLEIFLEAILEIAGEGLLDIVVRATGRAFTRNSIAVIGYTTLGALAGSASLLVFPHPLVHPSRFHGLSLLISPFIAGSAMSLLGSFVERRNKPAAQIESFGYGFAFALGMAAVRLLLTK